MVDLFENNKNKIVDYLSEGMIVLDENGIIQEYNRRAKDLKLIQRKLSNSFLFFHLKCKKM